MLSVTFQVSHPVFDFVVSAAFRGVLANLVKDGGQWGESIHLKKASWWN